MSETGSEKFRRRLQRFLPIVSAGVLIGVVGWIDYATGAEIRVYPLYYLPVSLVAWSGTPVGAVLVSLLSSISWAVSNEAAGLIFSTSAVWLLNTSVQFVGFITVGLLLSVVRRQRDHERRLAREDPLTSLLNSRAFQREAGERLGEARRQGVAVVLAYIDLDNFKWVNDQHGHHAGDEALAAAARTLRRAVRVESDLVARVGGDEFVVLIFGASAEGAERVLNRVRLSIEEKMRTRGWPVTASIGGVVCARPPESVEVLMAQADSAMYDAKRRGKNAVRIAPANEA
jgi:diguanylate cyclase (GGDEF)-like protein